MVSEAVLTLGYKLSTVLSELYDPHCKKFSKKKLKFVVSTAQRQTELWVIQQTYGF